MLLAKDPRGHIQACPRCSAFRLQFDKVVLSFRRAGLEQCEETMADRCEKGSKPGTDRSGRFISLRTSARGLQLTFSFDELGALLQMIQEAGWNLGLLHYRSDQ